MQPTTQIKIKYTKQMIDDNLLMQGATLEAYEIRGVKGYRAKPGKGTINGRTVRFVSCGTNWNDVAKKLGLPLFEKVQQDQAIPVPA